MGSIAPPLASNEYAFPLKAEEYAPAPTPSLPEWHQLWKTWDLVTTGMVPVDRLIEKPIPLRNDLLFYLGHIPTFEDIHLSRALKQVPTPPKSYQIIFERGIDPDVDDPDKCHDHSEIPEEWPPLSDILDFQRRVRQRITSLYKSGETNDRKVQRALWIGFEHECLHLETFLYMLIQSDAVKPPAGLDHPNFRSLALDAQRQRVENQWLKIPATEIVLGINPEDPEDETVGPDRYYGWDNERPARAVTVPEFEAQARPVTNEEYALYIVKHEGTPLPSAWVEIELAAIDHDIRFASNELAQFSQNKAVRTVYGPVPLQYALDWPIMASFDELNPCVTWLGGTIPTIEQARAIQKHVEIAQTSSQTEATRRGRGPDPHDVFVDLDGGNTGFRFFHPTPVTQNGSRLSSGLGNMGGAWEQTSSLLDRYEGFEAMDIYPGYTADFMDGKHYLVIGGSWATHPRIAGRKSFLNWWQPNYPYPWVTARLVRNA